MKLVVATEKCQGHARCLAMAPDVIELDDDGYNRIEETDVASGLESQARIGADACPEHAISVVE